MVRRLLDKGEFEILEIKLTVDYRGRSTIVMGGIGKSQEKEVEFMFSMPTHVVKGYPTIVDLPEPKKGVGRPRKTAEDA